MYYIKNLNEIVGHISSDSLINADCLEAMKLIEDKSIDCIICDLPYEVLNRGNKHAKWDKMIPLDKLWEQYCRIIKDNGAIILFGQGMFTAQLMISNPKMWRYNLIWNKNAPTGFLNANRMPLRCHEDICVFYKSLPTYNPQMVKCEPHKRNHGKGSMKGDHTNRCYGNYIDLPTTISDEKFPKSIITISKEHCVGNFYHPTQKPVALIEYLIKTYTNENELVLDNTAGSMTTAIAAINTNRRCICIEKDDKYFEIGSERVKKHLQDLNNEEL